MCEKKYAKLYEEIIICILLRRPAELPADSGGKTLDYTYT
jgi:hypothetical protein